MVHERLGVDEFQSGQMCYVAEIFRVTPDRFELRIAEYGVQGGGGYHAIDRYRRPTLRGLEMVIEDKILHLDAKRVARSALYGAEDFLRKERP